MKSLAFLALFIVSVSDLIAQLSFSVATDKAAYTESDPIMITITAKNNGSTPDTLKFTTGCQAGYFIDTMNYMHHDSTIVYCTQGFSQRVIQANDSTIWGGSQWLYYFTGKMIGPGKHAVVAWVSYLPSGWVSDSLWIEVAGQTSVKDRIQLFTNYDLRSNYPNPFNPSTTISFTLPKSAFVTLTIYNVLGQLISTLVNERRSPGTYNVQFDASTIPSGVYYYRLSAGEYVQTRKMLVLR